MRAPESHVAICGHAKHGKSTLAGRLMYEFGAITPAKLSQLRTAASELGKDFNEFSLLFLRRRGVEHADQQHLNPSRSTLPDRGTAMLGDGRILSLIDTPGHEKYRPHMVHGIYVADSAVLLVDATKGVERPTREIRNVIQSLGVTLAAVFVTKMDIVGYAEDRFKEVTSEIRSMDNCASVQVIPVSALTGAGFRDSGSEMPWFAGPTAVSIVGQQTGDWSDLAKLPVRLVVEGPNDVFSPPGAGTVVVGSLETGTLRPGDELAFQPASNIAGSPVVARVRSIQRARDVAGRHEELALAEARAIVAVALPGVPADEIRGYLRRGGMLGPQHTMPKVATQFRAELSFYEPTALYRGKHLVIHANASRANARITQLDATPASSAIQTVDVGHTHSREVVLTLESPLCIEDDPQVHRLTMFLVREHNEVVGCGRCSEILSNEPMSGLVTPEIAS